MDGSQLTAQSLEEPPNRHGTAATTGGTGAFLGARGSLQYTDNSGGSTTLRINLTS